MILSSRLARVLRLPLTCGALFLAGVVACTAQVDGTPRWAGPFTTGGFIVSSPAVAPDGTIYVGTQDKKLYAISPTGAAKWQFATGDWVDASPAIAPDGTIYVTSWDGKLYAITPAGAKKWEFSTGSGNYIYSSPALGADGTIYFGAGDGNFYAVRADGTLKWTYPAADWIDSSPAIGANGLIYYGSWDGNVYALRDEGATAREVWRFATPSPVLTSPALGRDGTVYIGSNSGHLYALDGATGEKHWDFVSDGVIEGSAAVGPDGTIVVGTSSGALLALRPDGTVKASFSVNDPIASTPAIRADGTIIVGTGSSQIYAFHPDLTTKWKVAAGDWVDSSPVVAADGTVYVGSYDKKLYAFNGSGAPASAFSAWPLFRGQQSRTGRVEVAPSGGRLINLATRALAGPGINLIQGFVVSGRGAKPYLVRAVGPTLAEFNVPTPLAQPALDLHTRVNGADTIVGHSKKWDAPGQDPAKIVAAALKSGAFALPSGSSDAATVSELLPQDYSVHVSSLDGSTGIALVEAYDADIADPTSHLINLSTRGQVGVGDAALSAGLVIGGNGPLRLLIRAVGPTLANFGVPGTLNRPVLRLFSGNTLLATNTGWATTGFTADLRAAMQAAGAFALNENSADSALLVGLEPGPYTMNVAGVGSTTGEAMLEVYLVP